MKATTEGVVRPPSALVMMVGLPPSIAATAELVVPRSMPTTCSMQEGRACMWSEVRWCAAAAATAQSAPPHEPRS